MFRSAMAPLAWAWGTTVLEAARAVSGTFMAAPPFFVKRLALCRKGISLSPLNPWRRKQMESLSCSPRQPTNTGFEGRGQIPGSLKRRSAITVCGTKGCESGWTGKRWERLFPLPPGPFGRTGSIMAGDPQRPLRGESCFRAWWTGGFFRGTFT